MLFFVGVFDVVFCRGMCMYRTLKMHELILKGVPDKYRGETWILFSGAINEVRESNPFPSS